MERAASAKGRSALQQLGRASTPDLGVLPVNEILWQLEGVRVHGKERPRLHDVTCTIAPGVTLVLGPSGAGKTTLLNLLVEYTRPTEGQVHFAGGTRFWMPAGFGLWPHVRVREHLELLHPGPTELAREVCRALLARFDLDQVAERKPRDLSTGQQSRLALARTLATAADVLVLDEPFAHLDDDSAGRARDALVEAVRAHRRSLVVATHAPTWLAADATATIELREGELVQPRPNAARHVLLVLFSLAFVLAAACTRPASPPTLTRTSRAFAMPRQDARAPAPRAVAPGPAGTWLVLDDAGRVLVYDGDGALQRQWEMPEHSVGNPEGLCALSDGRIVVADTHYHRLVFFTAGGRVASTLGVRGDGPLQFRYPVSVIQDARGDLYVAEYGGNDRVQKLRADGSFVTAFGTFGTAADELQRPAGLACHGAHLFVADAMNGRVQVFTTDGAHVRSLPASRDLACPYDVAATDDGTLVVVEYGAGCLTWFDKDGGVRGRYGQPGRGADQLATPWSVAVRNGLALIADTGNRRLVEVRL